MQTYVDELSNVLIGRYKLYLEIFMVDLWSEQSLLEFRFGYSLRRDSKLHTRTFKIGAQEALTAAERVAVVDAMFAEIEDHIDETISAILLELN